MAQDTEYHQQRPNCEYLLGIAKGKGIKITVPESSELLKGSHLYGYEPLPSLIAKFPDKQKEMVANYENVIKELNDAKDRLKYLEGAIHCINEQYDSLDEEGKKKADERKQQILKEGNTFASKINGLNEKVSYWRGANDLMQYFKVNWGY